MIDKNYSKNLDEARKDFKNTWDCSGLIVWHRDFKDQKYGFSTKEFVNKYVIVVELQNSDYIYLKNKANYFPFIYKGVPIKLWK